MSEFFRRSRFATRARGTQESYVLDYRLLFTFLWQRDRNWDEIRAEDLEDYEYWRRRDRNNPGRIGGSKWGRELAAFRLLYDWAVSRHHMTGSPVVLRTKQLPDGSSIKVPELAPTDTRSYNVKWLTPRAYRVWRDVGLRGYTADGLPDETWRGRNDGRDAAFADLLISSGLRRREAGSLLLTELPDTTVTQQYYAAHVATATAKRSDRYFYVSRSALKAIDAYRVSTRAEVVARAQRSGVYDALPARWLVRSINNRGSVQWVDEQGRPGKATLDDLDDLDRRKLYIEGEHGIEPMAIWLTETGLPMRYRSWNRVFGLANARCKAQGLKVFCSPHMLRHSFALQMVISLHYAMDRRLGLTAAERKYYETVYGNVWSLVKDLLGHASEETTKAVYLEPVRGLQLETLLNDASDESADELLARLAEQTGLILDIPQDVSA
ncbi:site-specific integrase [Amycolatopsis keratiniphila]|uniref:site-specific integrase n=1 Tax=Amycolatopsis keratiniphila TaxID=129921 RepID=UPI0007AD35CA|nr:site-specific integrase [Amycolatopsis keratiniphila]